MDNTHLTLGHQREQSSVEWHGYRALVHSIGGVTRLDRSCVPNWGGACGKHRSLWTVQVLGRNSAPLAPVTPRLSSCPWLHTTEHSAQQKQNMHSFQVYMRQSPRQHMLAHKTSLSEFQRIGKKPRNIRKQKGNAITVFPKNKT